MMTIRPEVESYLSYLIDVQYGIVKRNILLADEFELLPEVPRAMSTDIKYDHMGHIHMHLKTFSSE